MTDEADDAPPADLHDYDGHPALLQLRVDAKDRNRAAQAIEVCALALRAAGFSLLPEARAKIDRGDLVIVEIG